MVGPRTGRVAWPTSRFASYGFVLIRIILEVGSGDGTITEVPDLSPLVRWDGRSIVPAKTDDGVGGTYELATNNEGELLREVVGRQRYWILWRPAEIRFDR